MGKHRHERFRAGYAVIRIDDYLPPGVPIDNRVTVKEVWSTLEQAEAEVGRLNALDDDKQVHYFAQYVRVERED